MSEKESKVRLGEGISDGVKSKVNQGALGICNLLFERLFEYLEGNVQDIDFEKLFSKKDKEKIVSLWSSTLEEKGLLPKGYAGLPDNLLIDNMHQDGYIDGLYAGYALSMISLVDNNAPKELILSVRDEVRPNLFGHHYNDRDEFYNLYKSEKYSWVENTNKEDLHNR